MLSVQIHVKLGLHFTITYENHRDRFVNLNNKMIKQAGAELCQAQFKLG